MIKAKIIRYFPFSFFGFALVYLVLSVFIYYFNKKLLISSKKYEEIESYYDSKYNLQKTPIILIAVFYMILSISMMVLAGIYYKG